MAGDKDGMNEAMDSLMRAHGWRFTLHVDDKVDARLPHVPGEGLSPDSSWREARVLNVHEKNFQVHFLGYSKQFDTTIDRLSCDLQPLHTFTRAWRDRLKAGSKVEVRARGAFENDDAINHVDAARSKCVWEEGVVVQIGREIAGDDAGEDADGDETKQQEDEQIEPSRMALVAVMASSNTNAKKQWVNFDGEDVCQEGTHLSGSVADSRCVHVRIVERVISTIIT